MIGVIAVWMAVGAGRSAGLLPVLGGSAGAGASGAPRVSGLGNRPRLLASGKKLPSPAGRDAVFRHHLRGILGWCGNDRLGSRFEVIFVTLVSVTKMVWKYIQHM